MRAAARLLASVKPGQFLEAGAPTGLTGLHAHPAPRSALLYNYEATLDKLKQLPESSVYRQSTEALTKHRLKIVQETVPAGWDEWQKAIQEKFKKYETGLRHVKTSTGVVVAPPQKSNIDPRRTRSEWDGENARPLKEGGRSAKERQGIARQLKGDPSDHPLLNPNTGASDIEFPPEPQYTIEAISEIENRIGAGLIEEVIAVAEGEHKLVDEMVKSRVWEPLEEPAPEGQWSYHERNTHTSTQKP